MFPLSVENKIHVETGLDSPEMVNYLFESIKDRLKMEGASQLVRQADTLRFRVGMGALLSRAGLGLVDSGEVELVSRNPGVVRYRFSLGKIIVAYSIIVFLYALITNLDDLVLGAVVGLGMCVGAMIITYVIVSIRVPAVMRKAVTLE